MEFLTTVSRRSTNGIRDKRVEVRMTEIMGCESRLASLRRRMMSRERWTIFFYRGEVIKKFKSRVSTSKSEGSCVELRRRGIVSQGGREFVE